MRFALALLATAPAFAQFSTPAPIFSKLFGGSAGADVATALAFDQNGNVAVVGGPRTHPTFPSPPARMSPGSRPLPLLRSRPPASITRPSARSISRPSLRRATLPSSTQTPSAASTALPMTARPGPVRPRLSPAQPPSPSTALIPTSFTPPPTTRPSLEH